MNAPFPPQTLRQLLCWALIPVIVCQIGFAPFWFAHLYDYASLQLLFTSILLPLYLAVLGTVFVWRSTGRDGLVGLAILVFSVAATVFLDYAMWGFSTGHFWTPDHETVKILQLAGEVAFILVCLPVLVTLALRRLITYTQQSPNQSLERTVGRSVK